MVSRPAPGCSCGTRRPSQTAPGGPAARSGPSASPAGPVGSLRCKRATHLVLICERYGVGEGITARVQQLRLHGGPPLGERPRRARTPSTDLLARELLGVAPLFPCFCWTMTLPFWSFETAAKQAM